MPNILDPFPSTIVQAEITCCPYGPVRGPGTAFESAARGGISATELRYYCAQAAQLLALQLLARNPPATPVNAPMVGRVLQALADHTFVE